MGVLRETPARARVAQALADQGRPATIVELAQQLGGHPNTTRVQLEALVADGLADRETAPGPGRGRPRQAYRLTDAGAAQVAALRTDGDLLIREYLNLTSAFAEHLADHADRPAEDARTIGQAWGRSLAAGDLRSPRSDPTDSPDVAGAPDSQATPDATRRVVALLDQLGFSPSIAGPTRWDGDGDRTTMLRLRTCPLLQAAEQHPVVICSVHEGLVAGALEVFGADRPTARLEPFAEPHACLLHLASAGQRLN